MCTKIYVEISGKTNRVIRSVYRDNISQPHTPLILVVVVFYWKHFQETSSRPSRRATHARERSSSSSARRTRPFRS